MGADGRGKRDDVANRVWCKGQDMGNRVWRKAGMRWAAAAVVLSAALAAAAESPSVKPPAGSGEDVRLAAEAKALAEAAQKRYGAGYATQIDGQRHIVYVSALDPYTVGRVRGTLGAYADQQRQFLFRGALPWNVTVVLPTLADYRRPQATGSFAGHYDPATRTLESISLSDALLHEFTHALHHGDQVAANQRHPVWIREGLAGLFQRSAMREGRLEVLVGRDLGSLQEAARNHKTYPLAALMAMEPEAFLKDAGLCYAQSHYVMYYLHQAGKLKDFYETYKEVYGVDPSGGAALARTLGKPMEQVEADWRDWVLRQPAPWTPAHPVRPLLGVKMEGVAEGVRVTGFVRGSAAERGGQLKFGDVILSVAGQGTRAPGDLTAAVRACRPGETVDIEVIRNGQAMTVKHLLGVAQGRE
ncbi:MAG: PDZ domain-containing protein [Planctomycetes bacterium]|nr:PDZ domain-containing protein [Planctomycetota bacterium]